ncbi:hypothetical protein ILYODFUR_008737, partial [Ilyodon furcidens]
ISKQQLQQTKDRFQAFLNGDTQIVADEAFINAVQSYSEVFLKSDRVAKMVQSGGFSANDFREVFKRHIEKRVRSLPEIDGLSKETVLSSWMAKFDTIYRGDEDPRKAQQRMTASAASELILSKDQLYEMFQNILGIKKFEHQLLYQACQIRAIPLITADKAPLPLFNPKSTLKLLSLVQRSAPKLEKAIHIFAVKSNDLRLREAASRPAYFTLGCEPLQCSLKLNVVVGFQYS